MPVLLKTFTYLVVLLIHLSIVAILAPPFTQVVAYQLANQCGNPTIRNCWSYQAGAISQISRSIYSWNGDNTSATRLDISLPDGSSQRVLTLLGYENGLLQVGDKVRATVYQNHITEIYGRGEYLATDFNPTEQFTAWMTNSGGILFFLAILLDYMLISSAYKRRHRGKIKLTGTGKRTFNQSEPIIALRGWQLVNFEENTKPRLGLKSLGFDKIYLGKHFRATTDNCGRNHQPPSQFCSCGLYAAASINLVCSHGVHKKPCTHCVLGLVSNKGKLQVYIEGLRAEEQELLAIVDRSNKRRADKTSSQLAKELDLPLLTPDKLLLFSEEHGQTMLQ